MNEKWFGARITAPAPGTFSVEIARVLSSVYAYSDVRTLVTSYTQSGSRVRERSWKRSKYSLGRGSV